MVNRHSGLNVTLGNVGEFDSQGAEQRTVGKIICGFRGHGAKIRTMEEGLKVNGVNVGVMIIVILLPARSNVRPSGAEATLQLQLPVPERSRGQVEMTLC